MGYRVGFQCVETQLHADDLVLSATQPILMPDGTVIRPVREASGWFMGGREVKMSYPECSPTEQIYSGASVGGVIIGLVVVAWGFKQAIKLIDGLFKPVGDD